MKVTREESVIRVRPNGDVLIPAKAVRELLKAANRSEADLKEDLVDFGANRVLVLSYASCESGTEITLARDRRQEA